jgi:hypothetical protein
VMFHRIIDDPHQMGFAFSEVLAHVNYMLRAGRLAPASGAGGGRCLYGVNASRIRCQRGQAPPATLIVTPATCFPSLPSRRESPVVFPPGRERLQGTLWLSSFKRALQELGWVEGRNMLMDVRWSASNTERERIFAKELVSLQPDVIPAHGTRCPPCCAGKHDHCRQWPRNNRYQADATPYLGRTCTGRIAPALPCALTRSLR